MNNRNEQMLDFLERQIPDLAAAAVVAAYHQALASMKSEANCERS